MKSNLLFYPHYCLIEQMCASVTKLVVNDTAITTTLLDDPQNKLSFTSGHEGLFINEPLVWHSSKELFISSENSIVFGPNGTITNYGDGTIYLHSGIDGLVHNGTIVFPTEEKEYLKSLGSGKVVITYNPKVTDGGHKYQNPQSFSKYASKNTEITAYMLVHNAQDLQDVNKYPSGNYALSQDVDLNTFDFKPIGTRSLPFTGHFNGNGHTISNLHIETSDDYVGLFGMIIGQRQSPVVIEDLILSHSTVTGNQYAGLLFGRASAARIENIKIIDGKVEGHSIVGGVGGSASYLFVKNVDIESVSATQTSLNETDAIFTGIAFGALGKSSVPSDLCDQNATLQCIGHNQEVDFF